VPLIGLLALITAPIGASVTRQLHPDRSLRRNSETAANTRGYGGVRLSKPAMLCFSQQPAVLEAIDAAQYASLKDFRTWCQEQGLIETFRDRENWQGLVRKLLIGLAVQAQQILAVGTRFECPHSRGRACRCVTTY
jgi:hypothetical protein